MKTMNSAPKLNIARIITRCALIMTVAATMASFIPTNAQASVGTSTCTEMQNGGGKDGQETHG